MILSPFILACIVCCIAGTVGPIFRGILSKTVGVDEQGNYWPIPMNIEFKATICICI